MIIYEPQILKIFSAMQTENIQETFTIKHTYYIRFASVHFCLVVNLIVSKRSL